MKGGEMFGTMTKEHQLREALRAYEEMNEADTDFQREEILTWKPYLQNEDLPGPFIFLKKEIGGCLVGTLGDTGQFGTIHLNPQRLQRVTAEPSKEESETGMSFGLAIEAMKKGHRVGRKAYRCDGIRITKTGVVDCEGYPWMACSQDILADDWFILDGE